MDNETARESLEALPVRLETIERTIIHWLKADFEQRSSEGLGTDSDTRIGYSYLSGTHGMFGNWIKVLQLARSSVQSEKYLVWSNEHSAWWRANSQGYTIHLSSAGEYDRDEALSICGLGRDGWRDKGAPDEVPIRVEDARACSAIFRSKQPVS